MNAAQEWAEHEIEPGWYTGCAPDTSGAFAYTVLIRAKGDPERKPRGQMTVRWPYKTMKATREQYVASLREHLTEREVASKAPCTFNCLCVEMYGFTADVAPDPLLEALWDLTTAGEVAFTN